MYSAHAHAVLQRIITRLALDDILESATKQAFYSRLGCQFPRLYHDYLTLYGKRMDVEQQLALLIKSLATSYQQRSADLKQLDAQREQEPHWFLSQHWVGMALYADRFANGLGGVRQQLPYLRDLGVNMIHIMPLMQSPLGSNDGGYAVSDFRRVDARIGTQIELEQLTAELRQQQMLLTLDVVINHTSDEHEWVQRARQGDKTYQDYYYLYADRQQPDLFEQTLPDVFPETSPGSFTWDEALNAWVMTVFNHYQWDLNYRNPAVFREMSEIILHWANQGADILRLDAPAFIWKALGTKSQNLPEAHQLLQLFKSCANIVAPGLLFIAEAIVAPDEIMKYFGTPEQQECDIAYNATFMALLWDAVATRNTQVLSQTLQHLPTKPLGTTWLNYVRCHDDIGLGFSDEDIERAGLTPYAHRRYLLESLTGQHANAFSHGTLFGSNPKTGDARIAGSLAALAGLEAAIAQQDAALLAQAQQRIISLHALIMSYGGMALLYYGDELGTLNDHSYLTDPSKANDHRWLNRPVLDWQQINQLLAAADLSNPHFAIYQGLKRLIQLRQSLPVLADLNNRVFIAQDNKHLLVFRCVDPQQQADLIVLVNFDEQPHCFNTDFMKVEAERARQSDNSFYDLYSQQPIPFVKGHLLEVPACGFYWLTHH